MTGEIVDLSAWNRCYVEQILNDISNFEIDIHDPNAGQITDLIEGREVRITAGNIIVYGIVSHAIFSTTENRLTIKGNDYSILLKNIKINTANCGSYSTGSSGYRVIYSNVAFNTIAADIINKTSITPGTITNYGTTSIRFE